MDKSPLYQLWDDGRPPLDPEITLTDDDLTELSLLRSLEVDELIEESLIDRSLRFDETLLDRIDFLQPEVVVTIHTGQTYPVHQLEVEYQNISLPRLTMDAMRIECRKIVCEGEKMNNQGAWLLKEENCVFEHHQTALSILKFCGSFLSQYRTRCEPEVEDTATLGSHSIKNAHISEKGLDLSKLSNDETIFDLLGKLPEEICAMIPDEFRVLHVESVVRANLLSKFKNRRLAMHNELSRQPASTLRKCIPPKELERHGRDTLTSMATYLTTPKLTFHGTSNQFVPSIVRHGFLAPGAKHPETHEPLPVRCGSTYGQGIYSSPSAQFSLSYSGSEAKPTTINGFWGLKLIVCATIMGRSAQMTREDEWWTQHKPIEGADSHVGNNEWEYIVFDNSQILPCYVIHLDWGKDNEKYFAELDRDRTNFVLQRPHPKLVREVVTPGDRQRQKAALMAKASKYFPYGYGPATGTRFVVEDVAEVDEDEEEYGDYQALRIDATHEQKDFWNWSVDDAKKDEVFEGVEKQKVVRGSRLDEYTEYRS